MFRWQAHPFFCSLLFLLVFEFFVLEAECQSPSKSIAILVDNSTYNGINANLSRLTNDLEFENYNIILKVATYQQPEEVRSYLQNLYNTLTPKLEGAILLGNIPLARRVFTVTFTNTPPEIYSGFSTQYYSDLNGNFSKDDPTYPQCFSTHNGEIYSEIWISVLPFQSNAETTITKINQYLDKNHTFRTGNVNIQDGFLEVDEFFNPTTIEAYNANMQGLINGTYSWNPFTTWGNVGIYINNNLGYPDANYAYNNELQSNKYKFTSLDAHGSPNSNGLLTISRLNSMHIAPIFVWLNGCNTANLDYANIATEIAYSINHQTLVTFGGTTPVGGLGNNQNGYFGKTIATEMLSGKSLGEAYVINNNIPLVYPWSSNYELHNAPNIFVGDLSLTLFYVPETVGLITPNQRNNLLPPIEFQWLSSDYAQNYQLQISEQEDFSIIVYDENTLTSTNEVINSLEYNKSYYWRVRGLNPAFNGAWSEVFHFTTGIPVPSQPSIISGETNPCVGTTETYSITNVSGVTYSWSLPNGWTGTSTTNLITASVGTGSGDITVTPSNSSGEGPSRSLSVTTSSIPSQPGEISGKTNPSVGSSESYAVTNVSGVIYSWSLPSGWTGSSSTNSITVTVGTGSGDITVTPSNDCGSGASRSLSIIPTFVSNIIDGPLIIYPNPVNDVLIIKNINEETKLSIYTISGQKMIDIILFSKEVEINVSNLRGGIYLIKMVNKYGTLNKKLIKR
jgi:hypothetical protein